MTMKSETHGLLTVPLRPLLLVVTVASFCVLPFLPPHLRNVDRVFRIAPTSPVYVVCT